VGCGSRDDRSEGWDSLDVLQVLNWLCFLSLSLLSVTIPTYAISVAFLGRESRRSVWDREMRQKALKKKLEAMSKQSEVGMEALRNEIGECQRDIDKLKARSDQLSVKGAFIYPFVGFALAFALSVYGASVYQPAQGFESPLLGLASILALSYGGYRLYGSLCAANEAALGPETLAVVRVTFLSGSTADSFSHSKQGEVLAAVFNDGRERAEDILVQLNFPPEFGLSALSVPSEDPEASSGFTFLQTGVSDYAGYTTWQTEIDRLEADLYAPLSLGNVTMPSRPGRYKVPAAVWERKLGLSQGFLTFDIT